MTNSILIFTILINSITFTSDFKKRNQVSSPIKHDLKEKSQQDYLELRKNAINIDPSDLGLEDINSNEVYGIITDMGTRFGSVTIVSYLSGDAKIMYSSNEDLNNEISENKKSSVQKIFEEIQHFQSKGKEVEKIELPNSDQTTFSFLTKNGIYQISDKTDNLMMGNSDYANLNSKIESISALINN